MLRLNTLVWSLRGQIKEYNHIVSQISVRELPPEEIEQPVSKWHNMEGATDRTDHAAVKQPRCMWHFEYKFPFHWSRTWWHANKCGRMGGEGNRGAGNNLSLQTSMEGDSTYTSGFKESKPKSSHIPAGHLTLESNLTQDIQPRRTPHFSKLPMERAAMSHIVILHRQVNCILEYIILCSFVFTPIFG